MLAKKYNAKESEKKWQQFWEEHQVYKFNKESQAVVYSIDTPPPTVNGKIHIGHIFSYSQAEMMARYKRMMGFNVFYPFGFDDNGLPTERLVEQKYRKKAHETTREHFTELCLKETEELEGQFRELFSSVGFSCDWDYEYSTISKKAQITSQKSFLDLYEKKKAYFSEAPALWCTECQTAIAQAELETRELPSTFNYLKFFIEGSEEYIEIATTRPELLAACQCIFIHPDDEKNRYLLDRRIQVPLFDFTVPVLTDEKVDREKGSGMVMCCIFGDLTDLEWFRQYRLEFKEAILTDGTMSAICGKYKGMKIKAARQAVVEDLKAGGYMIHQEKILHNVAVHERCGTPMEITIKKQWFIDILSKKQEYIDAGNKIKWYPAHMKARYLNWVENLEWDWCISRQRYFGVPFPVWYCRDCGNPATAEVDQLPVNPLVTDPGKTCSCGCEKWVPEEDIMDTWATSSVTPLIHAGWYKEEDYKKDMIPMSVRPNAHDIIRTWDFYTIVKNLYHTGRLPWESIMISGHVMAAKNEKISKRKQNSKMEPAAVIEEFSADAVRLWAATGSLGNDIAFSEEEFRNGKKLINKLWNASKFVVMHLEGFEKKDEQGNPVMLHAYDEQNEPQLLCMDQWICASFRKAFTRYQSYMEKYEIGLALGEIERFFWGFCDDYIEIVKNRLYKPEVYGEAARKSGLQACRQVLLGMLKCFAVFMPHITEEIYQGYFRSEAGMVSIHQTILKEDICSEGEDHCYETGNTALEVISLLRRYKSEHSFSLKEDLDYVKIKVPLDIQDAAEDIKATCACKDLEIEITGEKVELVIVEKENEENGQN